jgi:hypothetical protein
MVKDKRLAVLKKCKARNKRWFQIWKLGVWTLEECSLLSLLLWAFIFCYRFHLRAFLKLYSLDDLDW